MATFVSLDLIKDYLKIDRKEEKHNTILDQLNNDVTSEIQTWLGQTVFETAYIEKHSIRRYEQDTIFVKELPIIAVAGITENGVAKVEDTDFYVDYETGTFERIDADFPLGQRIVVVGYTAGYATADIPGGIQEAAQQLVYRKFYDRSPHLQNVTSGTETYSRYDLIEGLHPDIHGLLKPHQMKGSI